MRNKFLLASALLRGQWLVFEDYANKHMPIVQDLLAGKEVAEPEKLKASVPSLTVPGIKLINPEVHSFDDAAPGTVAVIPVSGPLMRSSYCFYGMEDIAGWVDQAAANPNITGILMYVNSGGGTVDYLDVLASKFAAAAKIKPLVTYTDGYMCSAAYWLGSTGQHVMIGSINSVTGSIGTMWELPKSKGDQAETLVVRATRSKDKNESVYQAKAGNDKLLVAEMLDPINENFLATVQANRDGKLDLGKEDVLTGKVYVGKAAITHGLADSFGTFNEAVQKVIELSTSQSSQTTTSINQSINMKKSILAGWTGLIALFGITMPEGAASVEADFTPEKLAEISAKLEENTSLAQANSAFKANEEKVNSALKAAGFDTLEALVASNNDWKTKAETFGSQPGAMPTQAVKEGTDKIEEKEVEATTPVDAEAMAIFNMVNNK